MPDIRVAPEYDEVFCDNLIGWCGYLFVKEGHWECVTKPCKSPGTAANKAFRVFMKDEDGLYEI